MNKSNFSPFIKKLFEKNRKEEELFQKIQDIYGGENEVFEALREYSYNGAMGKIPLIEILSVDPNKIHPSYLGYFRLSILHYLVKRLNDSGEDLSEDLKNLLPDQDRDKITAQSWKNPSTLLFCGAEMHEIQ